MCLLVTLTTLYFSMYNKMFHFILPLGAFKICCATLTHTWRAKEIPDWKFLSTKLCPLLLRGPGVLKEALKTGISMKQLSGVAKRRSVTSYMVNQMLNHATFYRGKLRPNATKNYRNKLTSCKIKTKYFIKINFIQLKTIHYWKETFQQRQPPQSAINWISH